MPEQPHDRETPAGPPEAPFSAEQLTWLTDMLTPRCCHTVGLHDGHHFREQRYVCELQMAKQYHALRVALGLRPIPEPAEAISEEGCFWCKDFEKRQAAQAAEEGVEQHPKPEA